MGPRNTLVIRYWCHGLKGSYQEFYLRSALKLDPDLTPSPMDISYVSFSTLKWRGGDTAGLRRSCKLILKKKSSGHIDQRIHPSLHQCIVSQEWFQLIISCTRDFLLESLRVSLCVCVWWEFDCVIFPPFIIMTDSHMVGMWLVVISWVTMINTIIVFKWSRWRPSQKWKVGDVADLCQSLMVKSS